MEIVSAMRAALADRVGTSRYELWFGDSTRFEVDGDTLKIGVPSDFYRQWIRSNFRAQIDDACSQVLGRRVKLEFLVLEADQYSEHAADRCESSAGQSRRSLNQQSCGGAVRPSTTVAATADHHRAEQRLAGYARHAEADTPAATIDRTDGRSPARGTRAAETSARVAADGSRRAKAAGARMPFGGQRGRRRAALEEFVAGEANRVALAASARVARCPGGTPLFIYGPTSVGKTHLLEGIWTAARGHHPQATIIYQSAEQFTSQFLEALRGSGLPSFRRKYRGVDVLLLDDLHFLIGKRATRTELLHTVDTLLREGRQLVIAADRPPAQLSGLGTELITRLQSGMVCMIDPPDFATRRGIVERMAERMEMAMPDDVAHYIASRFTEHAREISGALCRLQATAEAHDEPISLALAKDALGELIRQGGPVVRLNDIERAVCEVLDLEAGSLHAPGRSKRVSHPRMLAMWLARKHTRAALSEIGTYFGRRRHSTVVSAQRRIEDWMAEGAQVEVADRMCSVDEAIRRIEQRLKAS